MPVAKKAPPRPRSFEAFISSISVSGCIPRAFVSARYPPTASYSASFVRSCSPAPPKTICLLVATAQLLDERGHPVRLDVEVVGMVDRDDGRPAAAPETLDRPQGHLAVLGRAARAAPELRLEC